MARFETLRSESEHAGRMEIYQKYGGRAKIVYTKSIKPGGLRGFFNPEKRETEFGFWIHETEPSPPVPPRIQAERDQEEKKKILTLSGRTEEQEKLLSEISQIKEKLEQLHGDASAQEHPSLEMIGDILSDNDFSPPYIRKIKEELRRSLTLEQLDDPAVVREKTRELIRETIPPYAPKRKPGTRVFVLVGPTGVGKTTTIAKLAAYYGAAADPEASLDVKIITIDCYRIGARDQIITYGEIMNIPVFVADNTDELRKYVDLNRDSDMIFVDTIGKSPKDFMKLAEIRKILEGCGEDAEVHLAVSATTKRGDLKEIFTQFEPFHYRSVVITKLDETTAVGNLVSLLDEAGKPVSYLTNGQTVPTDIQAANPDKLLDYVKGL